MYFICRCQKYLHFIYEYANNLKQIPTLKQWFRELSDEAKVTLDKEYIAANFNILELKNKYV